ncbi:cytochrome P450 [Actinocorallia lasiicapitis]
MSAPDRLVEDLSTFNPFGPHMETLYDVLELAREQTPIFFSEALGAWCLTRYEDIKAVASDHATYSSANTFPRPTGMHPEAQRAVDYLFDDPILTIIDPPLHRPQRQIVHEGFGPRAIAGFEPAIRSVIESCAAELPAAGRFDLVSEFCDRITLMSAMKVIGFPDEDLALLSDGVHDMITLAMNGPNLDVEEQRIRGTRCNGVLDHIAKMVEDRRENPRDDIMSMIVHGTFQGQRLSHVEQVNICFGLVNAGWHTTGGTLANIIRLMLETPERWAELVEGRVTAEQVATEGMRYDAATLGFFRTVTRPVELAGTRLEPGDRILLSYAVANRDPRSFSDPERFLPGRGDARASLSFGHGVHNCVGAPLARLELQISLEVLAKRYPRLHQEEPVTYRPFSQFKTPASLWVVGDPTE